jgi:hypothetical protein
MSKRDIRRLVLALSDLPLYMVTRKKGFLARIGWIQSVWSGMAVDRIRRPIPWFSYSAILFLEERLSRDMHVFEYGAGNSTLWFAQRVGKVVSLEADADWYERLKGVAPPNVDLNTLLYDEDGAFCRYVQRYPKCFDIIVVDARDRIRCALNAGAGLKDGGVIVWDDTHQPHNREGCRRLRARGYRHVDFHGMGPITDGPKCTTVFYRDSNCLGL